MEIDTNANCELSKNHPTIRELSKEEEGLYWSALKASSEAAEAFAEYREQHDEIDLEDPEFKKSSDKVQTAIAVSEVLEELATWRKNGIMADAGSKTASLNSDFKTNSRPEDEKNE